MAALRGQEGSDNCEFRCKLLFFPRTRDHLDVSVCVCVYEKASCRRALEEDQTAIFIVPHTP